MLSIEALIKKKLFFICRPLFITSTSQISETLYFNRYRRKRPKVDACIFDSALSHTRRSDASEEKVVSTFGRFRLWTSFESSPVSVKTVLHHSSCIINEQEKYYCQVSNYQFLSSWPTKRCSECDFADFRRAQ